MTLGAPRAGRLLALLLFALMLGGCASSLPFDELRAARFVLLGEVHDNTAQHRERAALLRELLADGRPSVVVFEQMNRGNDARIAAAPREPGAIADAGALDRRGWRWPLHEPVVAAALAGGAEIRGGNLARDEVRAVVRGRLDAVPADLRGVLAAPWSDEQQRALQRAVEVGHCNALPASQLPGMTLAQRARDVAMADALLKVPPGTRAVLIAGNGHVRTDLGVPHYLRAAGVPPERIVAIGFVERGDGDADETRAFDIVRYGPALARPDPCAELRR